MAKWIGSTPPPFTGTREGLTVYQLQDGNYYVRMQSSITGKRIKKDRAFKGFRDSSMRLKIAAGIASFVYRQLPEKVFPLYREMTGKAILWLKEGLPADVVKEKLEREYLKPVKSLFKIPPIRQSARLIGRRYGASMAQPCFRHGAAITVTPIHPRYESG
ncbi:hypothetical protein SAMN05428988_5466 [Chitinophaga sp. YR573]|uniref:hypothetical protein n=1 Tax=Chitinophaga sp. YR573 TaxID=1881040 RepID=UPI0008AE4389|nr:hypothetical protein [Chitinophaga sp. YR573]SEW43078.1 hypothetical protein SAMN05428988_5466 [Chitinophaga sp. YR573]